MKIYIWCALTYAPEDYRARIEYLKEKLREKYDILDFLGLWVGTDSDIYCQDIWFVEDADLLLMDCIYPSTGLGLEIWYGIGHDKDILAIAEKDAIVTRMILWATHPNYKFMRYDDIDEIIDYIFKNF